jgi:hypothetical protein
VSDYSVDDDHDVDDDELDDPELEDLDEPLED